MTAIDLPGIGPATPGDLRRLHLFNAIPDETLEQVFPLLRRTKHKARTTIEIERSFKDRIGFVWSGAFRIIVQAPNNDIVTMYAVNPRDAFGHVTALAGHSFGDAHRLIVDRAGVTVDVPAELFVHLHQTSPRFNQNVTRTLVNHALNYGARVYELASAGAEQRLLAELLRQASLLGEGQDRCTLAPAPKHAVLAGIIGASREQVSRLLKIWRDEGVIEIAPGTLTIVSMDALRARDEQAFGRRLFLPSYHE